jgi:phosphatidylserine/phosphatidylglycerophosphate/cardiolipin synthase-like enzyme
VDAILRARERKVPVRMIIDTLQILEPREQAQLQRLLAAGVPMKRDTHRGIMHMKVVIANDREFLTGSFNFTNNASENSDENMLIWDCQRNALTYATKFEQLWAKFKDATELVMRSSDAGVDAGK